MTVLVTAGPTREPIDPVRYLSNRSSGKMGYAIAAAAAQAGHRALLISGPTSLDIPENVDFLPVETAAEMFSTVQKYIAKAQAAFFTAAVADYTPALPSAQKLKKSALKGDLQLHLAPTQDILAAARAEFDYKGYLVGFAAETENLLQNATRKMIAKKCDLIVANDVSRKDIGFSSDENEAHLIFPSHTEHFPKSSKTHLATHLIEIATRMKTS